MKEYFLKIMLDCLYYEEFFQNIFTEIYTEILPMSTNFLYFNIHHLLYFWRLIAGLGSIARVGARKLET